MSQPDAVPPRDKLGAQRYAEHLPFQVFCCESGTHVVDPHQSYYKGVYYRTGSDFQNLSRSESSPTRDPNAVCLDSSQAWFCRDLWVLTARDAMADSDNDVNPGVLRKRAVIDIAAWDPLMERRDAVRVKGADGAEDEVNDNGEDRRLKQQQSDPDANAGSDYDAMSPEEGGEEVPSAEDFEKLSIPNSMFRPARILVNPRCPTTYAGVSHTQLARDLFGDGVDAPRGDTARYILEDWEGAPESFVCQEQK